jgi:hypothetical protein
VAIERLTEARAPIYAELADLTLDLYRMAPPQVVERIERGVDVGSDA